MVRSALATTIFACTLLAPGAADAAGAVLPTTTKPEPAFVDMRMAVAVSPAGSTRWSEITVPAATPVMWLVPVRPGAAIDWAPRRWLDAVDEATSLRVLPPSFSSSCPSRSTPEKPAAWTTPRQAHPAPALAVQTTADGARAYVAERGYRLSPARSGRISELYASGWNLVALEMASSSSAQSSGTLRVSDDGGAVLPLALSGDSSTRVTVFAIGAGVATVPGARDVDRRELRWGPEGSTFVAWRRELVEGGAGETWLRESSSHGSLFDGTPFAGGGSIASVVAGYLQGTSCTPSTVQSVGSHDGIVGTSCAPGAAARVPGGTACVPASGDVDPGALSCASDVDVALALAGLAPKGAVVTRLSGWIPAGVLGTNLAVAFNPAVQAKSPVIRADKYEACPPPATDDSPGAPSSPSSPRPPLSSSSASSGGGEEYVPVSDGCSGGAVATGTTYEEEPPPEDDGSSTESCSGDGTSGWDSEDESDGWDDSDSGDSCSSDDSSSSDSCSGGSSSSSSSGGSDDGWDTEDDDDGWDTEDGMGPQGKKLRPTTKKVKPHARTTKKKSSPVSRYALLAVALLLPLRRRRRGSEDG